MRGVSQRDAEAGAHRPQEKQNGGGSGVSVMSGRLSYSKSCPHLHGDSRYETKFSWFPMGIQAEAGWALVRMAGEGIPVLEGVGRLDYRVLKVLSQDAPCVFPRECSWCYHS